jgi:hypothetical protein
MSGLVQTHLPAGGRQINTGMGVGMRPLAPAPGLTYGRSIAHVPTRSDAVYREVQSHVRDARVDRAYNSAAATGLLAGAALGVGVGALATSSALYSRPVSPLLVTRTPHISVYEDHGAGAAFEGAALGRPAASRSMSCLAWWSIAAIVASIFMMVIGAGACILPLAVAGGILCAAGIAGLAVALATRRVSCAC